MIDLHRRHVVARKRSVRREVARAFSDTSSDTLAERLAARGSSPSHDAQRTELRARMRQAIDQLPPRDREVLVLRHLEQLTMREIATVLTMNESAVKVRHLRALRRLRELVAGEFGEGVS